MKERLCGIGVIGGVLVVGVGGDDVRFRGDSGDSGDDGEYGSDAAELNAKDDVGESDELGGKGQSKRSTSMSHVTSDNISDRAYTLQCHVMQCDYVFTGDDVDDVKCL